MRATVWGCRGSLSTPGEQTVRYGGNTTAIEVRPRSGRLIVLDAGTGIRTLGASLTAPPASVDLLLTHLHLDHVEGLGFFWPLFAEGCPITIWGPPQDGTTLAERVATWLSPPFFPRRFDELPAEIRFVECGEETWTLDGLTITSAAVQHPGNTLAYRLEEDGRAFAFIPDNELGLAPESGLELAAGAELLLHDAQYTAEEYATRVGWGHTSVDRLPDFLAAAAPGRTVMFHHDPSHTDEALEALQQVAQDLCGRELELAAEGSVYEL
jgi:phosphoribosyl 1,2-cyclic phosphodiesterase